MTTGEWIAVGIAVASFLFSMRKRRFDEAEWINEQYRKLIEPLEKRIGFLERALTKANNKLDVAYEVIEGLTKQLVAAGIKPAHKLDKE